MLEFTNPTKESAMGTATSIDPFDNTVIFGELLIYWNHATTNLNELIHFVQLSK